MVGIPTTLFCGVYINEEKIKYIGIVLVILFCCYNLFWYFGSYKPYNEFQKDFPEIEESGVKIYTDKDGFQYSVSVPDYLLWNGNLAIAESDVRYALIIWIKPFHQGISQGVLFNDYKDLNTQIMLSSSKKLKIKKINGLLMKIAQY